MLSDPSPPHILLYDHLHHRWLNFTRPDRVVAAFTLTEVLPALEDIDRAVQQGHWAAGFLAYEAAPAFDPAMVTHPPVEGLPLLWFGLFPTPNDQLKIHNSQFTIHNSPSPAPSPLFSSSPFLPTLPPPAYHTALAQIKAHIADGNTYQVNYTMRMRAPFPPAPGGLPNPPDGGGSGDPPRAVEQGRIDPFPFFLQLVQAQPSGYPAYLHTGQHAICSTSPELFFELNGDHLRSKPMKGTAPRGRTLPEDRANAEWLHHSEKNRAENVMIVDMVRNDMGRIAKVGSVRVPKLFEIERYPTVLQMTSTVECETQASLPAIFTALFPCASITGAPKIRTMQIIRELEPEPRGVYTGAIGFIAPGNAIAPGRRAQFNVAIRTVVVSQAGQAEYGVGSGIVWDSDPADEYRECLLKARVLTVRRPPFDLLESLLWTPGEGYFLLERHLARLRDSAEYFDYPFNEHEIRTKLAEHTSLLTTPHKIRLLLAPTGKISLEAHLISFSPSLLLSSLPSIENSQFTIHNSQLFTLAPTPILSSDLFLFHKTTHRAVYEQARAACPGFDEVLLWNERGEVTEFTSSNVVVQMEGQFYTPPVDCGLLAGTFRAALLEQGTVTERVILGEQVTEAEAVWAVNSVRGWRRVQVME